MYAIIKNLIHVVRRFKLAALLNVLGLSVAFAAFMIIMMQLNFHFGFDRFHKDYDKIFRVEIMGQGGNFQAIVSRPLGELFFNSSPHILGGTLFQGGGTVFFQVENNGVRNYFREWTARVSPEFTDVFALDLVEGTADALHTPGSVMIPLSMAHRLFGYESAVGRQLIFSQSELTVGAVFRDFPANSTFPNSMYLTITDANIQNWNNWNYTAYFRVNDATNVPLLVDNFTRNFDFEAAFGPEAAGMTWDNTGIELRLTALADVHFTQDTVFDSSAKANPQMLMILFTIAIVILAIAAINFTNFSTALSPMRVKNINTQRVMGAQRSTIRWILVIEAVVFCVVSYLVALLLVNLFGGSELANLVSADLSLAANLLVVIGTALVAITVGVIAGLYPSRYMTSFAPALALKGSFGLSPKGKRLRNTLIGIQFVASFVLIIGASFMFLQNRFMKQSDLGYDSDALITVDISRIQQHRDAFTHQLMEHPAIENITYAEQVLSSQDQYMGWGRNYEGETVNFQVIPVHYTFLSVMGIELTEGRNFRREDADMERGVFIFNETARQMYNLRLNTSMGGEGEIIGFMPDIIFASHRIAVDPMALFVWGTQNWGDNLRIAYIQLRSGANRREAMAHIRSLLTEFDPNYPFEVRFHDEVLQRLYEEETRLSLLITLFSLIAIFISIVGVFGLVVFDSECRRKEIGIRKVMGASAMEIVAMFNKAYFKILAICFVIAVPVAWFAVNRWLENFAFRTPMHWWVFALALLAVGAITALTVTIQNWRVANDDPVRSIKTE